MISRVSDAHDHCPCPSPQMHGARAPARSIESGSPGCPPLEQVRTPDNDDPHRQREQTPIPEHVDAHPSSTIIEDECRHHHREHADAA